MSSLLRLQQWKIRIDARSQVVLKSDLRKEEITGKPPIINSKHFNTFNNSFRRLVADQLSLKVKTEHFSKDGPSKNVNKDKSKIRQE